MKEFCQRSDEQIFVIVELLLQLKITMNVVQKYCNFVLRSFLLSKDDFDILPPSYLIKHPRHKNLFSLVPLHQFSPLCVKYITIVGHDNRYVGNIHL